MSRQYTKLGKERLGVALAAFGADTRIADKGSAVKAYVTGGYRFTASTSFANRAVTIARALTDAFAGIRPADAPGFILAQLVALLLALPLLRRHGTGNTQ